MNNKDWQPRLFNVPPPAKTEAVSSWLSRLALSQGASVGELRKLFRIPSAADPDKFVHGPLLNEVRQICGLDDDALKLHDNIVTFMHPRFLGRDIMACTRRGKPRFRYCPLCIREMRTPYFPIQWRFVAWRHCPVHACWMEDGCHHCSHPIDLPMDIAESKSGLWGYSLLNRCCSCASRLDEAPPRYLRRRNVPPKRYLDGVLLWYITYYLNS